MLQRHSTYSASVLDRRRPGTKIKRYKSLGLLLLSFAIS